MELIVLMQRAYEDFVLCVQTAAATTANCMQSAVAYCSISHPGTDAISRRCTLVRWNGTVVVVLCAIIFQWRMACVCVCVCASRLTLVYGGALTRPFQLQRAE